MGEFDITKQICENLPIKDEVEKLSREQLKKCYQCGKCTAGCPVAFAMDNPPRTIIRLLQVGLSKEALESKSPSLCATCETCYVRCPRGVDIPRIMESVRILAKRNGIVTEQSIDKFHEIFLKLLEYNGRMYELGLSGFHNVLSLQPLKDMTLAPKLFLSGKLSILPHRIKDPSEMKRLFQRVREKEKEREKGGDS